MMTDTGVEPDAWGFLIVCVPIVVIFAPLGSIISSHFHRQVLAFLIYILDTVALVTAFIVIPITLELGIMWSVENQYNISLKNIPPRSGCLLGAGFIVFFLLSKAGQRLLAHHDQCSGLATGDLENNLNQK